VTYYYILNEDGEPVPEPNPMRWARWYERASKETVPFWDGREHAPSAGRSVAFTRIESTVVSTIFLGIDHGFGGGPPVLFETMIFSGGDRDGWRWHTRAQAIAGHDQIVAELRAAIGEPSKH